MSIHINFNNIGNQIKRGFEQLPQQIAHVPDQLQHAGLDPHAIQDWIHHETDAVLHAAADEIAGAAFRESVTAARAFKERVESLRNDRPDLADAIDGVAIQISLSVMSLTYENFMKRAEDICNLLDQQSQGFQFRRSTIKHVIGITHPDKITFNISGELFTSVLSAGIGIDVPQILAVELMDMALEAAGVPE